MKRRPKLTQTTRSKRDFRMFIGLLLLRGERGSDQTRDSFSRSPCVPCLISMYLVYTPRAFLSRDFVFLPPCSRCFPIHGCFLFLLSRSQAVPPGVAPALELFSGFFVEGGEFLFHRCFLESPWLMRYSFSSCWSWVNVLGFSISKQALLRKIWAWWSFRGSLKW